MPPSYLNQQLRDREKPPHEPITGLFLGWACRKEGVTCLSWGNSLPFSFGREQKTGFKHFNGSKTSVNWFSSHTSTSIQLRFIVWFVVIGSWTTNQTKLQKCGSWPSLISITFSFSSWQTSIICWIEFTVRLFLFFVLIVFHGRWKVAFVHFLVSASVFTNIHCERN